MYVDDHDISYYCKEIVRIFEERGWGLYKCEQPHRTTVRDFSDIKRIIKNGREKNSIELNTDYILFPIAADEKPGSVFRMIKYCMENKRFPCYVDVDNGEENLSSAVAGVYPIKSIWFDGDKLNLDIDLDFIRSAGIDKKFEVVAFVVKFFEKFSIYVKKKDIPKLRHYIPKSYRPKKPRELH